MNTNSRTFWISLGCAVFSMFLIYSYAQEQKAKYDKKFGTTKTVLVAATDITEMTDIVETMVTQEERPVDFVQPNAAENPDEVAGLVAAAPIKKGEQILFTKLLTPGAQTGLSIQVAPDKRAITIPVDEVRGVGKLIRPGDRVDMLTSINYGSGKNQRREVKTLLQDILVLATGLNVTNNIPRTKISDKEYKILQGDTDYNNITVEVTPRQAQNLVYILSVAPGSLFFTLRNNNDKIKPTLRTATVDSVLGTGSERNLQARLRRAKIEAARAKNAAKQPRRPARQPTFVEIGK